MAEQSAEGTPIIGSTPMKHTMRHDGYCTCGGIPFYVDDPQDMLVCSISGEALQGERAQQALRERDRATFWTPEGLPHHRQEFLQRCRELRTSPPETKETSE